MIVTCGGLNSHLNTASTYSRESSASTLNGLINVVCIIGVGIEALFVPRNMIWGAKIYNPLLSYLCDIGIVNFLFIRIVKNVLKVE